MADFDDILAKARAATRGRRRWGRRRDDGSIDFDPIGAVLYAEVGPDDWHAVLWLEPTSGLATLAADSDFVEAVCPDVVIALVERLRAAEAERDDLRRQVEAWQARSRDEWERGDA